MKMFKRKKQRQEEKARVIANIVKESFEELRAEEDKMRISIPVPQRFYCMEHKIYETPQDFNKEMNRRIQASDYRNKVAYEKGRQETEREILQVLKDNIVDRIGTKFAVIDLTNIAQRAKKNGIELE